MKKLKHFYGALCALMISICSVVSAQAATIRIPDSHPSLTKPVTVDEFAPFISGLKGLGILVMGVCVLIVLSALVIAIAKLSISAGNDAQRSRAVRSILIAAVALSLFGGAAVLVSLFAGIF